MIELPNEGLHPTSRAVRIAAGTSRFAESISERQTQRRAGLGGHVAGTSHSHMLGLAQPGAGDLMLVIDTLAREARLWRSNNGRAYGVEFTEI